MRIDVPQLGTSQAAISVRRVYLTVFDNTSIGLDERNAELSVLDSAPVANARERVLHVRRHTFVRIDYWAVQLRIEARVLHLEREGVMSITIKAVGVPEIGCVEDCILDDDALLVRIERNLLHDLPAKRRGVAPGAIPVASVEQPICNAFKKFAF